MAQVASPDGSGAQNRIDIDWELGFEVLDEIGAAFEGVDPDEIEREVEKALSEVRNEKRSLRTVTDRSTAL